MQHFRSELQRITRVSQKNERKEGNRMTMYNEQAARTFSNELFEVTAVVKDEQILFDAEQVARNLGLVTTTIKNGKTYENVRWSRVNDFLPHLAEEIKLGSLLPEPLVYKLAFKANNEVAEKFQDWLAIDVLPSIRKNGSYNKPKSAREEMLLLMQVNEETAQRVDEIEEKVNFLHNDTRIDFTQQRQLQTFAKIKVLNALGGIKSPAYKAMSKRLFPSIYRELKDYFSLPRYTELRKKDFEEAMELVKLWEPAAALKLEIAAYNNQQELNI